MSRGNFARRCSLLEILYEMDGPTCFYCDRVLMPIGDMFQLRHEGTSIPPDDYPTLDHVWPRESAGLTSLFNLVVACYPCNISKANSLPSKEQLLRLHGTRRHLQPEILA